MPSGITTGGGGSGGGRRGGGDTSESEDEQDSKRSSQSRQSGGASGAVKREAGGGGGGSAPGLKSGSGEAGEEEDDDEDMFGVGEAMSKEGKGEGGKGGDVLTLIGSDVGRRSRSSKLPGMRVTGNVMSEDDSMRPVALPVTATAQTPGSRLFAQANNQAELTEEEDSSLFFVQLPTKLPRPLAACQRGKDDAPAPVRGKGKGKATAGGHAVKEEAGESGAGRATGGASSGKGTGAAAEKASEVPADDLAFDRGLRRMRPGKIGKLYVHQSGKARLVIGGVSLVVHPGLPVSFVEQGVSIDSKQKTFCSFGQVTKRAVCTPDFEQLYRRADEISGGGGGGGGGGDEFEGGGDVGGPVKMEVA
ncbi:unnamed protein product [Ectocarpus fasciculatus]